MKKEQWVYDELEKACEAIGVTVVGPSKMAFRLDKFLAAISDEQRKQVAALLQRDYGIAGYTIKPVDKAMPVPGGFHG